MRDTPPLMLRELNVVEQSYGAVLEAEAGCPVTEVAARHGVLRQSVYVWPRRYRAGRSGRPLTLSAVLPAPDTPPGSRRWCELRWSHR
jgi:transposase-like protein